MDNFKRFQWFFGENDCLQRGTELGDIPLAIA
jgi:hypothetical protein